MRVHEFDTTAGLEETTNRLARASRHPVFTDLSQGCRDGDDHDPSSGMEELSEVAIWDDRADERAYLASGRYNLVQHREVVDAIREAVSNTTGSIDKGVVRDYGAHVNGVLVFGDREDARVDVHDLVGDDYVPPEGSDWTRDRLGLGMRFHNSFDGRSGYGGSTMAYRYICQNWMVWGEETIARKSSYHIKGAGEGAGIDPAYFEGVIDEVFERLEPLKDTVSRAAGDGEMPAVWAPNVLEEAGFGRSYAEDITAGLARMDEAVDDGGETTLWNLYNAATTHVDSRAGAMNPERYDHHQESAWAVLEADPEPPEEEPESLEAAAGLE